MNNLPRSTNSSLSMIYFLLAVLILISTSGGVVYAVIREDTSTGLAIASYVLTCLSLILALVAAGEWLGLSKPNSFAFSYNIEERTVVSNDDAIEKFGKHFHRRKVQ